MIDLSVPPPPPRPRGFLGVLAVAVFLAGAAGYALLAPSAPVPAEAVPAPVVITTTPPEAPRGAPPLHDPHAVQR